MSQPKAPEVMLGVYADLTGDPIFVTSDEDEAVKRAQDEFSKKTARSGLRIRRIMNDPTNGDQRTWKPTSSHMRDIEAVYARKADLEKLAAGFNVMRNLSEGEERQRYSRVIDEIEKVRNENT